MPRSCSHNFSSDICWTHRMPCDANWSRYDTMAPIQSIEGTEIGSTLVVNFPNARAWSRDQSINKFDRFSPSNKLQRVNVPRFLRIYGSPPLDWRYVSGRVSLTSATGISPTESSAKAESMLLMVRIGMPTQQSCAPPYTKSHCSTNNWARRPTHVVSTIEIPRHHWMILLSQSAGGRTG